MRMASPQCALAQGALVTGAEIAMFACEGLLASVHSQVCRQAALSIGATIASRACEGLLSSVHKQMCRQVALVTG